MSYHYLPKRKHQLCHRGCVNPWRNSRLNVCILIYPRDIILQAHWWPWSWSIVKALSRLWHWSWGKLTNKFKCHVRSVQSAPYLDNFVSWCHNRNNTCWNDKDDRKVDLQSQNQNQQGRDQITYSWPTIAFYRWKLRRSNYDVRRIKCWNAARALRIRRRTKTTYPEWIHISIYRCLSEDVSPAAELGRHERL
jgi:hypothetical protein